MTAIHHDPHSAGDKLDAVVLNRVAGELDAAIQTIIIGGVPTVINIGTATELTIASGVITPTGGRHTVDTEADAAEDDLSTISGVAAGKTVFLSLANAARVVNVLVSGNIRTASGVVTRLDNINTVLMLYSDGTNLYEIGSTPKLKASTYNNFNIPDVPFAAQPAAMARNKFFVKAAAATVAADGVVAPTVTGTPSASNDTDSSYVNIASGAVIGNFARYLSATFNYVRRQHNPRFDLLIRTGAAGDIAAVRFWMGLCSAAPTNVDTLAGVASFIGFRYSTVAGDASFVPVCSDGAAQTVGAPFGAIAASTRYLLSFVVDSAAGTVSFRVNNGAPTVLSANLPAVATELGFDIAIVTTAAVAKNFKFSRLWVDYD